MATRPARYPPRPAGPQCCVSLHTHDSRSRFNHSSFPSGARVLAQPFPEPPADATAGGLEEAVPAEGSGGRPCHAAAFFGAFLAGVGAPLAVVGLVLAAFGTACFTDFRTKATDILHESRTTAHIGRCTPANLCTIFIQPDAFSHLGDVLLVQAGVATMLAFLGTANTGFDARLVLLVSHERFSVTVRSGKRERTASEALRWDQQLARRAQRPASTVASRLPACIGR